MTSTRLCPRFVATYGAPLLMIPKGVLCLRVIFGFLARDALSIYQHWAYALTASTKSL
jgi:hypothetical protein